MKTKISRKIKKKIKKIPIGDYCYADISIGDYEKAIHTGKNLRTYKRNGTFHCPFGRHSTHCSLLNVHEYGLLSDSVKICGMYETKDAYKLKSLKGKEQVWFDEKGKPSMKFGKDNTLIFLNE